jgi:hypothetical protein
MIDSGRGHENRPSGLKHDVARVDCEAPIAVIFWTLPADHDEVGGARLLEDERGWLPDPGANEDAVARSGGLAKGRFDIPQLPEAAS